MGSLSVQGTGSQRFVLLIDPALQGQIKEGFLSQAMSRIRVRERSIVMDYPSDVAVETLRGMGFREERALTASRLVNGRR